MNTKNGLMNKKNENIHRRMMNAFMRTNLTAVYYGMKHLLNYSREFYSQDFFPASYSGETDGAECYFTGFNLLKSGTDLNLSGFNMIKKPSKSFSLVFSPSSLENDLIKESISRCGILSHTIENISSSVSSTKSSSLVTSMSFPDLENSASLPLERPFGFETTSMPCFFRNRSSLLSTFSSKRNLSFDWDVDDDIFLAPSHARCIMQGSLYMLFIQRRESFRNLLVSSPAFEHLKNLPYHDSSALECGLSMADFAVCDNIFADFDPHEHSSGGEIFKANHGGAHL